MSEFDYLISGNKITDIAYQADPPVETIHPRITFTDGVAYVYCNKKNTPVDRFLQRLAHGEVGMHVAGYRPSNGKQTTISFNKKSRVRISARLQKVLEQFRAGTVTMAPSVSPALPLVRPDPVMPPKRGRSPSRHQPMSPEQLEKKLQRQAEIGKAGEEVAMFHEFHRLLALGCQKPMECIEHVGLTDVAAGYDIFSEYNGQRRHIEVKSSVSLNSTFFLSENERMTLQELGDEGYIYLVHVDESCPGNSRVLQEIQNPLQTVPEGLCLKPTQWQATLVD